MSYVGEEEIRKWMRCDPTGGELHAVGGREKDGRSVTQINITPIFSLILSVATIIESRPLTQLLDTAVVSTFPWPRVF